MSSRNQETEVFETPDDPTHLEESSKPKAFSDSKTDADIIDTPLKPRMAFERFAGKVYHGADSDFAGTPIADVLHRINSTKTEYNALPRSQQRFESPLERYMRLKSELAEFETDLQQLSTEGEGLSGDVTKNVTGLVSKELSTMQQTLNSLVNNPNFKPYLEEGVQDPSLVQQKRLVDQLLSQLQTYSPDSSEAKADGDAAGSGKGKNGLVYELYYNQQKDNSRQLTNLVDLDRRISGLETTLGRVREDKNLGYPDVHTAVTTLRRRIEFLDKTKIDAVQRRIKALSTELEQLNNLKSKVEDKDAAKNQEKVNKIFDMMTRWDEAAQQLPAVIARLQSLREVHEETANVAIRLQDLETQQSSVSTLLKQDSEALKAAQASLQANAKVMAGNVDALEKRFAALAKKMESL